MRSCTRVSVTCANNRSSAPGSIASDPPAKGSGIGSDGFLRMRPRHGSLARPTRKCWRPAVASLIPSDGNSIRPNDFSSLPLETWKPSSNAHRCPYGCRANCFLRAALSLSLTRVVKYARRNRARLVEAFVASTCRTSVFFQCARTAVRSLCPRPSLACPLVDENAQGGDCQRKKSELSSSTIMICRK